jgi:hypothetical protein
VRVFFPIDENITALDIRAAHAASRTYRCARCVVASISARAFSSSAFEIDPRSQSPLAVGRPRMMLLRKYAGERQTYQ